jgi:hypothetical protein
MTQTGSRPVWSEDGAVLPAEGGEGFSPPLSWLPRLAPLLIGRRMVRLEVANGQLALVHRPWVGPDRVVVRAPVGEFHSLRPSRNGRGLHLWHDRRLYRLAGRTSRGSKSDVTGDLGPFAVLLLPLMLWEFVAGYADQVIAEQQHVAAVRAWLAPQVGSPPPGVTVRPPLDGTLLGVGRWTLRLAVVVGATVAGFVYL